jgi:hypothetical protein
MTIHFEFDDLDLVNKIEHTKNKHEKTWIRKSETVVSFH